MKLKFDTSCDEGRIEEGKEIEPISGAVAGVGTDGNIRPQFHLMPDGTVTLKSVKSGVIIHGFGRNGELIED